jgi:hypothetical protein
MVGARSRSPVLTAALISGLLVAGLAFPMRSHAAAASTAETFPTSVTAPTWPNAEGAFQPTYGASAPAI